jgi:hypothetical protein
MTASDGEEPDVSPADERARESLLPWAGQPAVLLDRHLRVLAATRLARALSPGFRPGVNLVRFTFLDAAGRQDSPSWRAAADQIAALLRESLDRHEGDRGFPAVVGELSATSAAFARSWAGGAPAASSGSVDLPDTAVGRLSLGYRLTRLPDDDSTLVLFEPLDATAREALRRLAVRARRPPASDRPGRPGADPAGRDGAT